MNTHPKDNKLSHRYLDSKKCTWFRTKHYMKRNREREKNKMRQNAIINTMQNSRPFCLEHQVTCCTCENVFFEDAFPSNPYYDYDDNSDNGEWC